MPIIIINEKDKSGPTTVRLDVSENGIYQEADKVYSPVVVDVPQTTLEDITITENGVVTAPSGKAYKKITTDVPLPSNAYLLKEVDGLPKDIATFSDGSNLPLASLKVGIEPVQSGSGDPSPSNVRPISGHTEANVVVSGINIWDEEWEVGSISDASGQDATNNNYRRSKNFISVKANKKYYFNVPNKYGTTYRFYQYKQNKDYIGIKTVDSDGTFETDNDCAFIRFRIATTEDYTNDISINYPSTDTEYHAYNGHTTTIPFLDSQGNPVEVFGGECDVVNGTSGNKKTLGYVDMGNPTWGYTNGRFYYNPTDAKVYAQTDVANMLCSQYPTSPYTSQADNSISSYAGYIYVRADSYNGDITAFKQAMNGVQLVYELATPSTFYTQPTSIKSLEGVNNVWDDCGQIDELEYWSK